MVNVLSSDIFYPKKTKTNSHLFREETKSRSTGIARHITCKFNLSVTRKRKLFEKYHFFVFDIRKLCILS